MVIQSKLYLNLRARKFTYLLFIKYISSFHFVIGISSTFYRTNNPNRYINAFHNFNIKTVDINNNIFLSYILFNIFVFINT